MQTSPKTLLASIALSALLVGCGGSGSSSSNNNTGNSTLGVSGGATVLNRTSDVAIPASDTPAAYTFGGTTAVVPAGTTIPAGGNVAILSSETPVLSVNGAGDLSVDGRVTGVSFKNGQLVSNVALTPSPLTQLTAPAPSGGFTIGARAKSLTIKEAIKIGAPILSDGTAGIPSSVEGDVPANGSSTAGAVIRTIYPAAFAGYKATLLITWKVDGVNFVLTQTRTVSADGSVSFSPSSGSRIPATGIDVLSLSLAQS